MRCTRITLISLILLFTFLTVSCSSGSFLNKNNLFSTSTPHIDIIDLTGTVSTDWVDTVKTHLEDEYCVLVILNINSGGGMIAASVATTRAFDKLRYLYPTPMVVYSNRGLFSGAYMVANAGELIGLSPVAMTGSIGVIGIRVNQKEYFKEKGITFDVFRSGAQKASWLSISDLTEEQRKLIQQQIDLEYERFINLILLHRGIRISKALFPGMLPNISIVRDSLKTLCDGRTYFPDTALSYGLIDKIGFLDDYIEFLKMYYHIPSNVRIIYKGREYKIDDFLYE